MRQTLVVILLALWSFTPFKCQSQPDFCENTNFDGIFYFGWDLMFKSEKWFWRWDPTSQRMTVHTRKMTVNGNKVMTNSLFISRVPDCYMLRDCKQLKKALDIIFIRVVDIAANKPMTYMARINPANNLDVVTESEDPWRLGPLGPQVVWPPEWTQRPMGPKSSLFFPLTNEVYFIIDRDQSSELQYRTLDSSDWFRSMDKKTLPSDITYVGMFNTFEDKMLPIIRGLVPNTAFAVGYVKRWPQEPKLFRITPDHTLVLEVCIIFRSLKSK